MKKIYSFILIMASGIAVSASPMRPIASGGGAQPIAMPEIGKTQIVASHSTTSSVNKASAPDYQWGEWREYDHGDFNPSAGEWFEKAKIKVMRRDAQATSARYYQLKLCGVFGSTLNGGSYDPIDFVITVHPDGHMSWDEQETNLPYTYNGSTRNMWIPAGEGDAIHSFSTKRYVDFPDIWVYAYIDAGIPYGLKLERIGYLSDNHLEGNFSMALPGTSDNYGTNKFPFAVGNIDPGWTVKMVVSRGVYTYNDDDYSGTIAEALALRRYKGQVYELKAGLNDIPVTDGPGYYYINYVMFDPDGDWWSWRWWRVSYAGPDGYEWEPMGIGELQIGFFKNYHDHGFRIPDETIFSPDITSGAYVEPYPVKVERRKDAPGVIRIVNPFGTDTPFGKINEVTWLCTHEGWSSEPDWLVSFFDRSNDYYTVIDTRSEPYPYEVDYPCGFQLWVYDYGSTTFTDMHTSILNNTPPYYYKVDVDDRKISINDDQGNMLELTLPTGGVNDINADDPLSSATYYNLQGIEVSNPQKGQLLIRRCGTHTDKIVY